MPFTAESSCLLLIDLQLRLIPALADAAHVVESVKRLAAAAGHLDVPVYATEQNRSGLGETVEELRGLTRAPFHKRHFDATREDTWASFLPDTRQDIVVCGAEAHVCVLQTVLGLLRQGRRIRVVKDGVASRTAANRDAGLHRMEHCGAELVTSEMVMFEWLQTCDHPQFREVLRLLKQPTGVQS